MLKKKFGIGVLSLVMALTMLLSSTIYAADVDTAQIANRMGNDTRLTDENAPVYLPENFNFQQAQASDNAKMVQSQSIALSRQSQIQSSSASTWYTLSATFTMVGQIYSNYCVPASIRAALGHINGGLTSVPSQSTIAQNIGTGAPGTTGTPFDIDMVDYINENHSSFKYAYHTNTNISDMKSRLRTGIDLYDMPPIIWVITSASSEWGIDYNHVVDVYRFSTDENTVGIADPWPQYAGSGSTFYSISSSGVFDSLIAMVW